MSEDETISMYYINLDHRPDRKQLMENEFNNVLPNNYKLVRWSATKNPKGWIGCIHSHSNLLKHLKTDQNNNGFYFVLEDDCKINNKELFKEILPKYISYLKEHSSEWDLFMGGGIYASPHRIVCRDPFIIECDWMACSHFMIYNNISANKAIEYSDKGNYDVGIDNFNARSNRKRIWVPYPLLCDQTNLDTTIGNNKEYLEKIIQGFKNVHDVLDKFVKSKTK
jgi:hypothetical protein